MRVDWNNLSVKLYKCTFSAWRHGVETSGDWPRIMHDNDLWLMGRGRGELKTPAGKIELRPGRILWLRPGYSYQVINDPDDPIAHFYLHFDLIRPDGSKFYPSFEEVPEMMECFNHSYWYAMAANIRQIQYFSCVPHFQDGKAAEIAAVVEPMVKDMLAGIVLCHSLTHGSGRSKKLDMVPIQAADYFASSIGKIQPVAAAARNFGLSRSRFTKVFTDFWHISPQQYQILQRIEQAKYLLQNTASSIGEIAVRLGYSDPYFFSRQFKKVTGMSPNDYRLGCKRKMAPLTGNSETSPQNLPEPHWERDKFRKGGK